MTAEKLQPMPADNLPRRSRSIRRTRRDYPPSAAGDDPASRVTSASRTVREDPDALTPEGYADAVRRHSVLNNGIGRNYIWLSDFLGLNISTSVYVRKTAPRDLKSWVVQYPIAGDDDIADAQESSLALTPTLSPRSILSEESTDNTGDSFAGERRSSKESSGQDERRKFISFSTHKEFSASIASRNPFQSTVTFLHGYTSPAWINHIGAGYNIDPEFFCRHLDFRGPEESPISFSIPSIPSSCCYLIDLPVITIGERDDCTSSCTLHEAHIEALRREAAIALDAHRREIKYIDQNRPKMVDGQSMVRDYYVFDETHFAVEQRISICMERPGDDPTFQLIVWSDSGDNYQPHSNSPDWPQWKSCLPVIVHKHKIALKARRPSQGKWNSTPSIHSAADIHKEYGHSLDPATMAKDAFYCLTEIFSFAASSQMQFLNLIDLKLDRYTSLPTKEDFKVLPNLKYTKKILERYIQKTECVLESIRSATSSQSRWPKASDSSIHDPSINDGSEQKARIAAQRTEQDFQHLLNHAETLHRRTTEAITVLLSSISISESQRALAEAESMGKLTFLAFTFVPLSFTTSFFGMNVGELDGQTPLSIGWWILASALTMGLAFLALYREYLMGVMGRLCRWVHGEKKKEKR